MRRPFARVSSSTFSVWFSISLILLTGGCDPRIAASELPRFSFPEFARMFPDFSRMMADLFGTDLDVPVPQQPPTARPAFADRVIVLKSQRLLQLAQNGKVFQTF